MTSSRSPIDFSASFRLASSLVFGLTLLIVVAFDQAFFGLRIHGRRNLRLPRALLVSNHSMTLDPGIIAHALRPRRTLFSAMQRTFAIPVLGTYIRLLGAFPLPTKHPIERLRSPIERAAACHGFVHFFPEGKLRRGRRDVSGFQDGVFLLSVLTGIPCSCRSSSSPRPGGSSAARPPFSPRAWTSSWAPPCTRTVSARRVRGRGSARDS